MEDYVYYTCHNCKCFWQNNDTENQCEGQEEICHEFIEMED